MKRGLSTILTGQVAPLEDMDWRCFRLEPRRDRCLHPPPTSSTAFQCDLLYPTEFSNFR